MVDDFNVKGLWLMPKQQDFDETIQKLNKFMKNNVQLQNIQILRQELKDDTTNSTDAQKKLRDILT